MRQLAYYLDTELDCAVKVGLPEGETKEDVADWLEQDDAATVLRRVKELLQDYEPDEADRIEPPPPPLSPLAGDIVNNEHYQLVGLAGDAVAIRISAGRVLKQSRESLTQPGTLISLAPLDWWYRLTASDTFGSVTTRRIGDGLLRAADDLGQADLSRQIGTGAVMLQEGAAFHLGDRILLGGKEYALKDGLDGRIWLAEPRVELGAGASDKDMRDIAESVMAYRWATPADGQRFLGWVVAALVGGALEWRPHMYLTSEASVGKSWILKNVLGPFLGPIMHKIADATPAALARLAENASIPMVIDEAEASHDWVVDLLKLLRVSAGSEGARVRADGASGGVVKQLPRFSALLSSTSIPEMPRADATRMSVVQLGDEVKDWPAVKHGIQTAIENADAARYRIIRRTADIVAEAAQVSDEQQRLGRDSREAMLSGALTAGWRAWGLDRKEVDSTRTDPRDEVPDAVRLLFDITNLPFRLDGGTEITLLEALQLNIDPRRVADTFGLKRSVGPDKAEDGGLAIWPRAWRTAERLGPQKRQVGAGQSCAIPAADRGRNSEREQDRPVRPASETGGPDPPAGPRRVGCRGPRQCC